MSDTPETDQWSRGIHSCHNACVRPMCVLMRERVKALENALKILMGDVDYLGHWIPDPCRRLVDDALLTNCPDCREFRGHGHECKSEPPEPPTRNCRECCGQGQVEIQSGPYMTQCPECDGTGKQNNQLKP